MYILKNRDSFAILKGAEKEQISGQTQYEN